MEKTRNSVDCTYEQIIYRKNCQNDLNKKSSVNVNSYISECIYGADNKPATTIFHGF